MRAIPRFVARRLGLACLAAATVFTVDLGEPMAQEIELSHEKVSVETPGMASQVLPGALSAELGAETHAVGSGWAGYDGASRNPVASATAEAWIVPRLSVMAGFGSTTQPGEVRLRAEGGVRLMVLDQQRYGINATVGFLYRQDRFADEEGTLEWSATLSRRFGATLALVRLLYAQDGEGDDHEGEIRAAVVRDITSALRAGVDARARTSLGSSDPHRMEHSNPTFELSVAPVLAYTVGRWSVMGEAGVSAQKVDQWRKGVLVLGGFGAAF